jgi:enoyl-CoA hydratase
MAEYQSIIYENVEDKIFRITLNRPEKINALSPQLLSELDQATEAFDNDPEASVLIIRGAGRGFCAGYDLSSDYGNAGSGRRYSVSQDFIDCLQVTKRWQRLWSITKPIIAQVHGFCLAGANELVGHCDIVFASEDATFGHPAGRQLGVLPTMALWPVLMGPRKAKEYFFTGDSMTAQEALDWHLVNRIYPREKLEAETLAYARRVALVSPELLVLHKAAVNRYLEGTGFRAAQQSGGDIDVIFHNTEAVKAWVKNQRKLGLKGALAERDRAFKKA